MPWSNHEKALAKIAWKEIGWADPQYRLVLQNIAGIKRFAGKISSTNPSADQAGFVRYMAFCEQQGFIDRKNGQGYWTQESGKQQARIHYRIRKIAERAIGACLMLPGALDGFVERQTASRPVEQGGPTRNLDECDALYSYKILEGLKGWLFRAAKDRGVDTHALFA